MQQGRSKEPNNLSKSKCLANAAKAFQMRHARTGEGSRLTSTNRVGKSPDVMLHRTRETANKFAGCFIVVSCILCDSRTRAAPPRRCKSATAVESLETNQPGQTDRQVQAARV